jgi:hypothetical protein
VSVADAISELIGDLDRFRVLSDRVEGLVEAQVARYRPKTSDWLVVPWANGFYLFSEDMEGQRRGREVVSAFLGPSVVILESLADNTLEETLPAAWKETGLVRASSLGLVGGQSNAEKMVSRLEDMVAAFGGRTRHLLEIKPSPSDLLRDFRLALIRRDDDAARQLLDQVRLTGHVSAENLRYLRLEYLAAFERWSEMRALPHLRALLQARRPRAISEHLMRMVWWTELVGVENQSAQTAFAARGVVGTYGPLLRSVRVPSTPEGRLVGFLCALSDVDTGRQEEIIDSAVGEAEQARLRDVSSSTVPVSSPVLTKPDTDPVASAFDEGRYSEVINSFLSMPSASYADLAVQAVLESGDFEQAPRILSAVREFDARGELKLDRRTRRDLEDLERLSNDTCADWLEWSIRLGGESRWPDASSVLRDSGSSWPPLASLDHGQVNDVCNALMSAVGGVNDDQLRGSLDLLCREAATQLARGSADDFCRTVLLLLSEQDNFSEMVRSAYLDLFAAWFEVGPACREYADILEQSVKIWSRVRSPNAIGWAVGVLEAVADSPCPDEGARTALAVELIEDIRRQNYARATIREKTEIEELAGQFGLPSQMIEPSEEERDLWSKLNGKLVGIYSLLPRAKTLLERRLARLCSVGDVKGNTDEVGTQALRALAERADFLIVDTWHAAHQATAAIDAVRPRNRQVLPRQRGISGFLRALEAVLGD